MNVLQFQRDPKAFREALLIDHDGEPKRFAECIDDWQSADFAALDTGWRRAAGQKVDGQYFSRGWVERPRGHSKSSDAMVSAVWALFASRKKINGIVAAVDKEQAAICRDHVARIVALNPWLSKVIDILQWRVVNQHTGSSMEIMASDVASSYGLLIDFAVCDEVTLWPKRDLFDSILSAAAKRSTCLLLAVGNAGFMDSWQTSLREQVKADPGWYFSRLDGPRASWISADLLAEQERLLPESAYARLWLNQWASGAGDAIPASDIAASFKPDLQPMSGKEPGWVFVAGLDVGVSRDASAVCVLAIRRGRQEHGRIRLAHLKLWRPSKDSRVDLQHVENELIDLHLRFDFKQLCYDPWQATHLASRLQSIGLGRMVSGSKRRSRLPMVEVPQTGSNLQRLATVVREAFADRRLDLYRDADLERDIRRLRVVERSYGFRLESPRDATGHGDAASAFQYAMLAASELATKPVVKLGSLLSGKPTWKADFEARQAAYARDQQRMEQGGSDPAGREEISARFRRQGRARKPFSDVPIVDLSDRE